MPDLNDPEQTFGNLRRLVERARQSRRWETTAFPTSGGGTLHVPRQGGQGGARTGGGEVTVGTPPIGEIIRVGMHGHLGNGNEPVLFEIVNYRNGFEQVVVPSGQVTLPHAAIYGIEGELRWTDGYTGGGTVTLVIDNVVKQSLPGFTSAWTRFPIATEFDAVKGQRMSIFVDHDDVDSDHDLVGTLVIATKEPLKEVVQSWERVASIDAWGMVHDGTHWWVTTGFGERLRRYSSSWVQDGPDVNVFFLARGLAFNDTSDRLWVATDHGTNVPDERYREYDLTGTFLQQIEVGNELRRDFGIAWDTAAGTIWASSINGFEEFDPSDGSLLTQVDRPFTGSAGLDIFDGDFFAMDQSGNSVVRCDMTTGEELDRIGIDGTVVNGAHGVWVGRDGTELYVSKDGDGVFRLQGLSL